MTKAVKWQEMRPVAKIGDYVVSVLKYVILVKKKWFHHSFKANLGLPATQPTANNVDTSL